MQEIDVLGEQLYSIIYKTNQHNFEEIGESPQLKHNLEERMERLKNQEYVRLLQQPKYSSYIEQILANGAIELSDGAGMGNISYDELGPLQQSGIVAIALLNWMCMEGGIFGAALESELVLYTIREGNNQRVYLHEFEKNEEARDILRRIIDILK
jgi:hypothetical protein